MMNDDPFLVLGLPPDCDDDARIRATYHDLVRAGRADARINNAYAAVRHATDRRRWRWQSVSGLLGTLPADTAQQQPDWPALIQECASLNDWELGEPL